MLYFCREALSIFSYIAQLYTKYRVLMLVVQFLELLGWQSDCQYEMQLFRLQTLTTCLPEVGHSNMCLHYCQDK